MCVCAILWFTLYLTKVWVWNQIGSWKNIFFLHFDYDPCCNKWYIGNIKLWFCSRDIYSRKNRKGNVLNHVWDTSSQCFIVDFRLWHLCENKNGMNCLFYNLLSDALNLFLLVLLASEEWDTIFFFFFIYCNLIMFNGSDWNGKGWYCWWHFMKTDIIVILVQAWTGLNAWTYWRVQILLGRGVNVGILREKLQGRNRGGPRGNI